MRTAGEEKLGREGEWSKRYQDLKILTSMVSAAGRSLKLEEVLNTTIEKSMEFFEEVSGIEIYLLDPEKEMLYVKAQRGLPPGLAGTGPLQLGEGLAGHIVKTRKPLFVRRLEDDGRVITRMIKKEKLFSYAGVPIVSPENVLGVVGFYTRVIRDFSDEEQQFLSEVGYRVGVAVQNALEYEQIYDQIKTSEERYRTLFEATGTSLVIIDEKQRFRLVNHAFETLSGYPRDALIGQMELHPFLVGKGFTKKGVIEKFEIVPQSWEAPFVDKNGEVKQVHITTTRIPGSTDVLVSLIDMTRERELERRLFRTEELAAIGELSAGIAHEIRNPLVVITTSVSLLKDESMISEEGKQLLDVVKEESDHLAAIVDDFLLFAKPKKPLFEGEDINKLLKDVVKRCREWNGKGVKWVERYDNDLQDVSLDRHQIQQVITNLLLNSLDAMLDCGVLTIETRKEKSRGEERVRITVTDSGVGIPEEDISKIFQPFYSTKEKGTGMGLAICRRIINDHDGEIFVESKVGKGTTFFIVLPLHKED
jgi:two-component system NtrC family sensor kinase